MVIGEGPFAVTENDAVVIPSIPNGVNILDAMGFDAIVLVC